MGNQHSRRLVLGLGISVAAFPLLASCAHRVTTKRVPRIGFIMGTGLPAMTEAFHGELRRLGYIEGKNIIVETRLIRPNSTDGATYVAELAHMDLDLIVAPSLPIALGVREENPAMPMVVATAPGMVSNGLARSLEHPGGNVTGMDELPPGLTARRLKRLKEAAPAVSRVALLSTTPGRGGHEIQLADAERAAPGIGVSVKAYVVRSLPELQTALAAMIDDGMDGLLNFQGALSLANRQLITDFAARHRVPAIYQSKLFVEAGGLMSLAPDQDEQFRIAARYADRILRGARPGDLPIRHPARYFLTINAKVANALGLSLSPGLLADADSVVR
ncbi:ABC transporter substrate-binding protein [Sphingomonas sp. BT-65]|uniref:ABC transporter substrate-binding protein n=1 Tax=Sphingomonas sp. BT-65 TaxID=2989821 RepID=UPI0022363EF4|nr:ABC transporter substrate-binding protein [Sphingomonas sp. BT-65]MCW4460130.1 ABC transporter substrate-binding protein [Sphingomonas sp. BT-65]